MINWEHFRAAYLRSDSRQGLVASLLRLEAWLEPVVAFTEAAAADSEVARATVQAATVLEQRLLHSIPMAGGHPAAGGPQALLEATLAGHATPEQRVFVLRHQNVIGVTQILKAIYPELAAVPKDGAAPPPSAINGLEAWLDGLVAGVEAALGNANTAHAALQAVPILRQKLLREGPIDLGGDVQAQLQAFAEATASGRATIGQRAFWLRFQHMSGLEYLLKVYHPDIVSAPAAPTTIGERMQALSPLLQSAAEACGIGAVTPAALSELSTLQRQVTELADTAADADPLRPTAWSLAAHAALALAKGHALLGDFAAATPWFRAAATNFERAGEPEAAEDSRRRLHDLLRAVSGDVDRAAEEDFANADSATDPLRRAQALVNLAALAAQAHNLHEAEAHAENAGALLTAAGYADPEADRTEAAINGWIARAASVSAGTPFLRTLQTVNTMWQSILGTRHAVRMDRQQTAEAEAADRVMRGIADIALRLGPEAEVAVAQLERQWQHYAPSPVADAEAEAVRRRRDAEARDRLRLGHQVDTEILAIQAENNEGRTERTELLRRARRLLANARAARVMPQHIARVQDVSGQVLLRLGKPQEALADFAAAEQTLLGGRPAALQSFSTVHEREQFLSILKHTLYAHFHLKDDKAVLALCERTIAVIEPERNLVSQPNLQGAFLEDRTEFYLGAALAAFRLQSWDKLLAAIELLKARAALRNRLVPSAPDESESALLTAFAEVNAERADKPRDREAEATLGRERRRLWDRLAIARMRHRPATDMPEVSVASIQAALAPDEAAIAWLFLSDDVLLVVAIDSTRLHAERIMLQPRDRRDLDAFVSLLRTLRGMHLDMDKPVARLGSALLPEACRRFIAGKRRLVLSPHRSLHLFPFHATRWGDASFLIETFSIRYVPNLGSLLLPWNGTRHGGLLAIGIGDFAVPGQHLTALPHAEAEARGIAALHAAYGSSVELLVGAQASCAAVSTLRTDRRLGSFRCVHLATHGISVFDGSDTHDPLETCIYLYDGTLDGIDIASSGLRAELVVMSACHSGQRATSVPGLRTLPADDIFGLSATLFHAGVRSVLGALWPVDNPTAFIIQPAFHRAYAAGAAPESALQSAITGYLAEASEQDRKICYWAPFFLASLGRMDDASRPTAEQ